MQDGRQIGGLQALREIFFVPSYQREVARGIVDIQRTLDELSAIPVDDRIRVVQLLWDSIPPETEITVTPEQQRELDRRIAAHDADPDSTISRKELERRLEGRG